MKKVSELFTAQAYNPWEVANNLSNGSAGFRIPEYQRTYDWSENNIHRLMSDLFTGFERLSRGTGADTFTFLGTLILVKDQQQRQEPKFRGRSYSIVDGQQRLTTLTLLSCVLIERLRLLNKDLPKLSPESTEWLSSEAESLEEALASCTRGVQLVQHGTVNYPFPRIVRSNDRRGDSTKEEELKSAISIFLSEFIKYIQSEEIEFLLPEIGNSREAEKILENFRIIKSFCEKLNDKNWFDENDFQFIEAQKFTHGGYKQLWKKLQDVNDGNRVISELTNNVETHNYFRTLMLAAYFCNCVAVTTVITPDESAAFDIFDALNTTGEPLTALETLKPHVINAVNQSSTKEFQGSDCSLSFEKIEKLMSDNFQETKQKQDETKNLLITFALYLKGRKISQNLSDQRKEILKFFNESKQVNNGPKQFMEALAFASEYRCNYWVPKNFGRINYYHAEHSEADEVKLLCSLISATKTSLTLPILLRYWVDGKERQNYANYMKALKAVTAFLVLRRSATGGTIGIDTCFRDIMEAGSSPKKFGLCTGSNFRNNILDVEELKESLKSKLDSPAVKFSNKEEWINHVLDTPIYTHSQPLVRFILFCATNYSAVDVENAGLLTRKDILSSDDRNYLTFDNWVSDLYCTVEHVAPNSDKSEGWDPNIYSNSRIKNTLGNLVLLPAKENIALGNATWKKKKIFYNALTGVDKKTRESALNQAKREGIKFHKKTEDIILNTGKLSMSDGIQNVESWDKDFIEKRTRRIASLAWDELWPWLGNS